MEKDSLPIASQREGAADAIEAPAGTAAPVVLALGVSLMFAGLATHVIVSATGAMLALAGIVGWFGQVLPEPVHDRFVPRGEVPSIGTSRHEVERVVVTGQLRANLPIEFYPISAGIRGGVAGGAAMAVLAVMYGVVSGYGIFYPINLLAAGFFPSATLDQLSAFHANAFFIAAAIHVVASTLVGVLYGAMLPMIPRRPIILGGLLAPLLWTGLLHSSLSLINPVLAARIDWSWFVISQLGFGFVAGWVVSRRQRVASDQPLPWRVRAGIEATGLASEPSRKGLDHG